MGPKDDFLCTLIGTGSLSMESDIKTETTQKDNDAHNFKKEQRAKMNEANISIQNLYHHTSTVSVQVWCSGACNVVSFVEAHCVVSTLRMLEVWRGSRDFFFVCLKNKYLFLLCRRPNCRFRGSLPKHFYATRQAPMDRLAKLFFDIWAKLASEPSPLCVPCVFRAFLGHMVRFTLSHHHSSLFVQQSPYCER